MYIIGLGTCDRDELCSNALHSTAATSWNNSARLQMAGLQVATGSRGFLPSRQAAQLLQLTTLNIIYLTWSRAGKDEKIGG